MENWKKWVGVTSLVLSLVGCESDEKFDHQPPAGMGSIVVNNHANDDLDVFFNGVQREDTRHLDWTIYDLNPGVYRVVLDQDDGPRNWRGDVDVLANRLTVLDVYRNSAGYTEYDVAVYFEDP